MSDPPTLWGQTQGLRDRSIRLEQALSNLGGCLQASLPTAIAGVVASSRCQTQPGREEQGRWRVGGRQPQRTAKHRVDAAAYVPALHLTDLSPNRHRRRLFSPQDSALCLSWWFLEMFLHGQAAELSGTFEGSEPDPICAPQRCSESARLEPRGAGGEAGTSTGTGCCCWREHHPMQMVPALAPSSSACSPGRGKALFVPVYRADRSA